MRRFLEYLTFLGKSKSTAISDIRGNMRRADQFISGSNPSPGMHSAFTQKLVSPMTVFPEGNIPH